jgi:hypothetical protein
VPELREKVADIGNIGLPGGRVEDGFNRDTKIGEAEYQDEDPEEEVEHYLPV